MKRVSAGSDESSCSRTDVNKVSTATVLIVDDATDVVAVAQQALRRGSYDVITASSGREALELLSGTDVDLVLAEVLMPGMMGTELIDIVNHRHPFAATMLMAGYTGDKVIDPGVPLLRKPFTAGELISEVRRVLAHSRQRLDHSAELGCRHTPDAAKSRGAEQP